MTKTYRTLTTETLVEIAQKYTTRREFYLNDASAFTTAKRREIEIPHPKKKGKTKKVNLLDHICTHMFQSRFKWTEAMILNVAQKYTTRTEFATHDRAAYSAAARFGILSKVCAHMPNYKSRKRKQTEGAGT